MLYKFYIYCKIYHENQYNIKGGKMFNKEMVENTLKKYNQEHIIEAIEKMNEEEQQKIIEQISQIDFEQITRLYENTKIKETMEENKITPIDYIDKYKIDFAKLREIKQIGEQVIKNDEYAVVTMAGRSRYKAWM